MFVHPEFHPKTEVTTKIAGGGMTGINRFRDIYAYIFICTYAVLGGVTIWYHMYVWNKSTHFPGAPVISPLHIDIVPRIQSGDVLLVEAFKETRFGGRIRRWRLPHKTKLPLLTKQNMDLGFLAMVRYIIVFVFMLLFVFVLLYDHCFSGVLPFSD